MKALQSTDNYQHAPEASALVRLPLARHFLPADTRTLEEADVGLDLFFPWFFEDEYYEVLPRMVSSYRLHTSIDQALVFGDDLWSVVFLFVELFFSQLIFPRIWVFFPCAATIFSTLRKKGSRRFFSTLAATAIIRSPHWKPFDYVRDFSFVLSILFNL